MNIECNSDLALLALRISVGYVFLFAAWKNTKNEAARKATIFDTSLLFQNLQVSDRMRISKLCAIIGMIMMYLGGISVLLGLEPRIGGILIAVFSALGMRIHAIKADEAKQAGESGNLMGWSGYSGHSAAEVKNWGFIGAGIFFLLGGVGDYGFGIDYLGQWLAPTGR
jgi:uncharacterized membrane protein YphA (DoxX/SURF4 family)